MHQIFNQIDHQQRHQVVDEEKQPAISETELREKAEILSIL